MAWFSLAVTAVCLATLTACAWEEPASQPVAAPPSTAVTDRAAATTPAPAATSPAPAPTPAQMLVPYRVEVRSADPGLATFPADLAGILADPRGWSRAGFSFVAAPSAPHLIVLAEADEVDRLCRPMDTYGRYSCQNGPVVALSADRWRSATPQWTGDLDDYRVMLVNHEVGHLLHLHHPTRQCPGRGLPAPVMAQQSTELGRCRPNPWPLQWEVDLAAQRREPLAPGPGHDPADHRPTPPPVRR